MMDLEPVKMVTCIILETGQFSKRLEGYIILSNPSKANSILLERYTQ